MYKKSKARSVQYFRFQVVVVVILPLLVLVLQYFTSTQLLVVCCSLQQSQQQQQQHLVHLPSASSHLYVLLHIDSSSILYSIFYIIVQIHVLLASTYIIHMQFQLLILIIYYLIKFLKHYTLYMYIRTYIHIQLTKKN